MGGLGSVFWVLWWCLRVSLGFLDLSWEFLVGALMVTWGCHGAAMGVPAISHLVP